MTFQKAFETLCDMAPGSCSISFTKMRHSPEAGAKKAIYLNVYVDGHPPLTSDGNEGSYEELLAKMRAIIQIPTEADAII